jgi:hypothetical protein
MPAREAMDPGRYLGLSYDEAADRAVEDGWHVRKREPDGVYTMEYRSDRLNLDVDETDRVVQASVG